MAHIYCAVRVPYIYKYNIHTQQLSGISLCIYIYIYIIHTHTKQVSGISPEAQELIRRMLTPDPDARPNASQARFKIFYFVYV